MISWDLETDPFGPCNLAPEPVCVSVCDEHGSAVVVASCESAFDDVIEECLKMEHTNMNIAFDMAVLMAHRPKFRDLIFDAYRDQRVHDIAIREKILVLASTGDLSFMELPNGTKIKLKWSQAALENRLLGIDRSEEKDADDAFRKHFNVLKGRPASEYPKEAYEYALSDAVNAKAIHLHQQKRADNLDIDILKCQHLNARAAFALYLSSCWGFPIDRKEVRKLSEELHKVWDTDAVIERDGKTVLRYEKMLDAGILIPAVPPLPYKSQRNRAEEVLGFVPMDWSEHREKLEEAGIKFTKEIACKYSDKKLKEHVKAVCELHEIPVPLTGNEDKNGNLRISFNKEAQADLKGLDDILDEYIDRKEVEKLVTTELPRMNGSRVHPRYDVLKTTGRTSSYGNSKDDKEPAYPAVNIQNVDPRVRHAYVASKGNVLCSTDYSTIELASIAQKCLTLFGKSVLAEKINAGMDAHAYLAASIASLLDPEWYGSMDDPDENYRRFKELEGSDRDEFYQHYRSLAKPTGLGLPGGLGASRFIGFAKSSYGVDIVKIAGGLVEAHDLSRKLKQIWLKTFPEMSLYFQWVSRECIDIEYSVPGDERYAYVSPKGMVRRNCIYTEATNGAGLQTPTAEGAKIALWKLAEAMYDSRKKSCLLGSHMLAFIHDEVIFEFPFDDLVHQRALEGARLMVEGMQEVLPDVRIKAEPVLMFRWNKKAKPTFNENGELIPWHPASAVHPPLQKV